MMILAEIFKTTLDELVNEGTLQEKTAQPVLYQSETIYDIDRNMHFDMHLGSAKKIVLTSGEDEKLHVKLESETLPDLHTLFKIKLDEKKKKLDVDCVKKKGMSRYEIEDAVVISILLPAGYTEHCELEASARELEMTGLQMERLEYDGDAGVIRVNNCRGCMEFTAKTDYELFVDRIDGRIDVNQWRARSVIHVRNVEDYRVTNKGRHSKVYYRKNGEMCEAPVMDGSNEICISGIGSELILELE
ncbi:MAG: hypothetical protein IJ801_02090 [Lachnospiraceae bacterium]|nr:hypothetical protein [Lachnospiraceae bacterium]